MSQIHLTLNNGVSMPALGLGVFQSSPEETSAAVQTAIQAGYRLVDTAAAYRNERQVGEGIQASGVAREQLFVTTKLWMSQYGYEEALKGFDGSLKRLGLDYLDLYLLHWPVPATFDKTVQSYRAAEKLLAEGLVRAIGVCNFNADHLKQLTQQTSIVPGVNQIELHPYFNQSSLRETNLKYGIVTQSWSPIGGAQKRNPASAPADHISPLDHPVVRAIAESHQKTPAQVVLRWHLQLGLSVIPKSVHPQRIAENFDVFDFSLTAEEVAQLDTLDTGKRSAGDPTKVEIDTFKLDVENQ